MTSNRNIARKLAEEAVLRNQPLDWFERLYDQAKNDPSLIPWADMEMNPNLENWLNGKDIEGNGKTALVVGCGLGDDAEGLASLGFQVTAFDLSSTCVDWCLRRFPESTVNYCVADILKVPHEWKRAFDFVFEAYTLQVLPDELRIPAARNMAETVAPGGVLLVITRGRDADDDKGKMPWPLVRNELRFFSSDQVSEVEFEEYFDEEDPPVRRFRVEFQRAI